MVIYPFSSPIILTDAIFTDCGGKVGTFTSNQLKSSYWVAEREATQYIGAFLLPVVVTGTYPFALPGEMRIATDYGYVSQILDVQVLSQISPLSVNLKSNPGLAYIYDDTFGYIDTRQVAGACGIGFTWWMAPNAVQQTPSFRNPYQIQLTYESGLPTGTANFPGILEALTIAAQLDLNEKDPGNSGMNESVGDIGVQDWSARNYRETRVALKRTAFGTSAKAMYASHLIDISVKKCRRQLSLR